MKSGVFALLAAILLAVGLIGGCIAPLDKFLPGGPGDRDQDALPDGKGAIRLILTDQSNAQVIIPNAPDIVSYAVNISDDSGVAADITDALTSNTNTYIVNEGDYTIEVEASTVDGLVAVGEESLHITAGQSTTVTIKLYMIDFADATAQGTFSYDITLSASPLAAATMTITTRGSYGTTPDTSYAGSNVYNFLDNDSPSNATPLYAGFYSVVFELNNGVNTIFYRQVLHVYQNMTSHFEREFTASDFPVQSGALVFQNHLDYTEDPVDIANPDRGFFRPSTLVVPTSGSGSSWTLPSGSIAIGSGSPTVSVTTRVNHLIFDLRNYSSNAATNTQLTTWGTTQAITADGLGYIRARFDQVRAGSGVAYVRFTYDNSGWSWIDDGVRDELLFDCEPTGSCTVAGHTDKNWIQYHIYQIKPILHDYEDIIMAVEGGFFGPWGEMHSTTYGTSPAAYHWLLNALLDAVPASRSVVAHAGAALSWYNREHGTTLNFSSMGNYPVPMRDTPEARFGYFNDSYAADSSDWGSLSEGSSYVGGSFDRGRVINWIRNQNNFYGGEAQGSETNYNRFPYVAWEAAIARTTHLNRDYSSAVHNRWKDFIYNEANVNVALSNTYTVTGNPTYTRAVFDPVYDGRRGIEFMRDRLGYRLVLRDANVSDPTARTGTLVFEGKIQNVGWGNVVNKKNVYVILKNKSTGTSYSRLTDLDARDWLADLDGRASNTAAYRDVNFTVSMSAFGSVPAGNYDIYLKIQNPGETRAAIRCIQFANKAPAGVTIWDSTLGANLIGSVTVTN